ncbi:MAG: septal ring lytic transglycosylase RlpA family protein [Spirochaetes bacterium]|nr:septal ring lytic transglycosylase RlpA family protein [Spirochaetota bacterium]
MKALSRFWIIVTAGILLLSLVPGCTPEGSLAKQRDFRGGGESRGGDEETYDFSDSRDGGTVADSRKERWDTAGLDGEDSSYKKDRYYQTGAASWYGREFHGKKTASGERFNMNDMTAAHRVLPFGTLVKVRNFDNGRSVTVRINDRGPYRGKRIIDLSHAAARELGMLKSGEVQVGIQLAGGGGENDNLADEGRRGRNRGFEAVSDDYGEEGSAVEGTYSVQAGAFYSRRNADGLKMRIEGMTNHSVSVVRDGDMYKVRVEGLDSRSDVNRVRRVLSDEDIPSFLINRND